MLISTGGAKADQKEQLGIKLATNSTPKQVLMESLLKVQFIHIFSMPLSTSSYLLPPHQNDLLMVLDYLKKMLYRGL